MVHLRVYRLDPPICSRPRLIPPPGSPTQNATQLRSQLHLRAYVRNSQQFRKCQRVHVITLLDSMLDRAAKISSAQRRFNAV